MAGRKSPTRWDTNLDLRLEDMVAGHNSIGKIAYHLGVEESAVHKRMTVLHFDPKAHGYSVSAFGRLMGVSDKTTQGWIDREKWLTAFPIGFGNGLRVIDEDEVLRFLAYEQTWVGWEPEQISDPALREHATELRGGVRYLSSGEAARYLGYTDQGLIWNIHNKRLPALWYHRSYWFQLAWLEEFVRRRDAGEFVQPRTVYQFSHAEEDFLRRYRPTHSIGWLAQAMCRKYGSVLMACQRLGLDGPRQHSRSQPQMLRQET